MLDWINWLIDWFIHSFILMLHQSVLYYLKPKGWEIAEIVRLYLNFCVVSYEISAYNYMISFIRMEYKFFVHIFIFLSTHA